MRFPTLPLLLLLACSGHGCKNPDYVTRAELRDLLAPPDADSDFALSPDRSQQLARIAAETFAAPPATAPAAEVMAAADEHTAKLANALRAVDESLGVCADNIANGETTAYKRAFATRSPNGTAGFRTEMEQGSLESTGRPLDLAISGNGFFRVKVPESGTGGFAYTRNGNFFVNSEGILVLGMGDGYRIEPPIAVPQGVTQVSISETGSVEAVASGHAEKFAIGQVELSLFINPQGLKRRGGSMYLGTPESGPPTSVTPGQDGAGTVLQGFLEASNVDLAKEYLRVRFLRNWRSVILRAIEAH